MKSIIRHVTILAVYFVIIIFSLEVILRTDPFNYLQSRNEINDHDYLNPFKIAEKTIYHVNSADVCFNHNMPEFNYKTCYNSLGIRDTEHSIEKPNDTYRIISLGDSFTEGIGAPFDSTWWKLLEGLLNEHSDSLQYEAINGGVQGSDLYFSYVLLRDKLIQFTPDLVILCINASDIGDISIRGGMDRFNHNMVSYKKKAPWWLSFYVKYYTVRIIVYHFVSKDYIFRTQQEVIADDQFAMNEISKGLLLLNNFCQDRKTKFLAVFHPMISEIETGNNIFAPAISYCDSMGIPYLNLYKNFIDLKKNGKAELESYHWKLDGHYTPKGYSFMANEIFQALSR